MRGVVSTTSPLTVLPQGSATAVPARLPLYPSITVTTGSAVLLVRDEGQLIVIARLA